MEIEKTFSTIEEIKAEIEKEGFTFRFSFDEEDENENQSPEIKKQVISSDRMTFAVESDLAEIEKWEAALPDIEDDETEDMKEPQEEQQVQTGRNTINATVLYFDLFQKRTYVKTLIFQKEDREAGDRIYCLVGFCEAPMS